MNDLNNIITQTPQLLQVGNEALPQESMNAQKPQVVPLIPRIDLHESAIGHIANITIAVIACPIAVVVIRLPSESTVKEDTLPQYASPKHTPQKIADCPWKILQSLLRPFFDNDQTAKTIVIDIRTPSSIKRPTED